MSFTDASGTPVLFGFLSGAQQISRAHALGLSMNEMLDPSAVTVNSLLWSKCPPPLDVVPSARHASAWHVTRYPSKVEGDSGEVPRGEPASAEACVDRFPGESAVVSVGPSPTSLPASKSPPNSYLPEELFPYLLPSYNLDSFMPEFSPQEPVAFLDAEGSLHLAFVDQVLLLAEKLVCVWVGIPSCSASFPLICHLSFFLAFFGGVGAWIPQRLTFYRSKVQRECHFTLIRKIHPCIVHQLGMYVASFFHTLSLCCWSRHEDPPCEDTDSFAATTLGIKS